MSCASCICLGGEWGSLVTEVQSQMSVVLALGISGVRRAVACPACPSCPRCTDLLPLPLSRAAELLWVKYQLWSPPYPRYFKAERAGILLKGNWSSLSQMPEEISTFRNSSVVLVPWDLNGFFYAVQTPVSAAVHPVSSGCGSLMLECWDSCFLVNLCDTKGGMEMLYKMLMVSTY